MKYFSHFLLITLIMSLFSCSKKEDLYSVDKVDLEKYAGKWYEIQRFPNRFEKGLSCVTATYTLKENGKIGVFNRGYKAAKEKWSDIEGSAKVPDSDYPGRLKVTFFWPFAGDYYIIDLDPNYEFALVGDPTREYLWILARTPDLDPNVVSQLREVAKKNGFDINRLISVDHSCED